ncbi:MAG: glycosyltransferase [Bacteroidota bacterium]
MIYVILMLYGIALFTVFIYGLIQLDIIFSYLKKQRNKTIPPSIKNLPKVTIQLPIYNEDYVVKRLIKSIIELDYPKELLEIQVLDDSDKDSFQMTKKLVATYQQKGFDVKQISRKKRTDFKAGALKNGLKTATGEFIAIFDADFIPKTDWLKQTIPHFYSDSKIGVVQTRWGHINRNYSLLTKVQAFALDYHFILEQNGRSYRNSFINFNGTAGIWRKKCILDAGNWQGNTLTEDLDLSYRAQAKQWKIEYLDDVETPAELPVSINAAKSQQFRWNKGAAENFQKNIADLFQSKRFSFGTKIHGLFHLLNSSMFLVILMLAILSLPVLWIKQHFPETYLWYYFFAVLGSSSLIFFIGYFLSFTRINGKSWKNFFSFLGLFFSFFSIAMGLSLHNSIAVLEGHFGKKSAFIRTPKFNIRHKSDRWENKKYRIKTIQPLVIAELLFAFYFGYGIWLSLQYKDFGLLPFFAMLTFGFGFVGLTTFLQRK